MKEAEAQGPAMLPSFHPSSQEAEASLSSRTAWSTGIPEQSGLEKNKQTNKKTQLGIVVHSIDQGTWEAEEGRFL